MGRSGPHALAVCGFLVLAYSACDNTNGGNKDAISGVDKLTRLSLKLSTTYRRELDKNDFSLFYRAVPPGTIVLEVKYRRRMDQPLLRSIVKAAEENAKGVARDQYGMYITTRVEISELTEPEN